MGLSEMTSDVPPLPPLTPSPPPSPTRPARMVFLMTYNACQQRSKTISHDIPALCILTSMHHANRYRTAHDKHSPFPPPPHRILPAIVFFALIMGALSSSSSSLSAAIYTPFSNQVLPFTRTTMLSFEVLEADAIGAAPCLSFCIIVQVTSKWQVLRSQSALNSWVPILS